MMRMVNENNLNHKVKFTGKISDDHLFELYSQTDCVVIPSRSESIPVVLSEALQFNKPMIVTDVGDMGMLGRRYGIARVVEKENIDALAHAMRDFIEKPLQIDPQKRNELLSLLMMENSMQKMLQYHFCRWSQNEGSNPCRRKRHQALPIHNGLSQATCAG